MTAPDFRQPPSPHASKPGDLTPRELGEQMRHAIGPDVIDEAYARVARPGEPPQLWPLDDPDYYRREQRPPYGAGIVLAIPIGFALWAFIIWLVLG